MNRAKLISIALLCLTAPHFHASSSYATTLVVDVGDPSASDSNSGGTHDPLKTIQHAVDIALPGDTVSVRAGTYDETVHTKTDGSTQAPITIAASGIVHLPGIEIRHSYIEVDGFTLDGNNSGVYGYSGVITIRRGVSHCEVRNNVLQNWKSLVYGIWFEGRSSDPAKPAPADHCIVRNNVLQGAGFHMINVDGSYHEIANNTFDTSNGWDAVRLFGAYHTITHNYFYHINEVSGVGNHTDIIQGFDDNGDACHDIAFIENFVLDSDTQPGQINNDRYSTLVYNWTFRGNVYARMNIALNLNVGIKGVTFENNTLYKTGLVVLGSVSDNSVVKNNLFIGTGRLSSDLTDNASSSGWYAIPLGTVGASLFTKIISDANDRTLLINELKSSEYIDSNSGLLQGSFTSLTSASALILSSRFEPYRAGIYTAMKQVQNAYQNFSPNYNFVTGENPTFSPKSHNCLTAHRAFDFCEPNGINGGDPHLRDIVNPLGADQLPLSDDDGLRPEVSSSVCTSGENGSYIGAYPCQGTLPGAGAAGLYVAPTLTPTPTPAGGGSGSNTSTARTDFDGDGISDPVIKSGKRLLLINSSNGRKQLLKGIHFTDMLVSADYDGDGKADPATVHHTRHGLQWQSFTTTGKKIYRTRFGAATETPISGCQLGDDARADLAVFSRNRVRYYLSSTHKVTTLKFANFSRFLSVACVDPDKDGIDSFLALGVKAKVRKSAKSSFALAVINAAGTETLSFDVNTSGVAVCGDIDADGSRELGVARSSRMHRFQMYQSNGANALTLHSISFARIEPATLKGSDNNLYDGYFLRQHDGKVYEMNFHDRIFSRVGR